MKERTAVRPYKKSYIRIINGEGEEHLRQQEIQIAKIYSMNDEIKYDN